MIRGISIRVGIALNASDILRPFPGFCLQLPATPARSTCSKNPTFTLLNTEISALRSEIEKNYTNMRGEVKEGENRMIKYALGFLGSFGALGLGAYRAMQR